MTTTGPHSGPGAIFIAAAAAKRLAREDTSVLRSPLSSITADFDPVGSVAVRVGERLVEPRDECAGHTYAEFGLSARIAW
jgi:hypothetical protein